MGSNNFRPVGYSNANPGIQAAVPTAAARLQRGQDDCSLRPQQFTCLKTRSSTTPGERCHRTSRLVRTTRWVFLHLLHHSKERWRCKAHTRPSQPQQVPEDLTISYVAHNRCSSGSQAAALVYNGRPKGCLLPRSNCSSTQAIPPICIPGPGLSIPGPPIRPVSVTTRLHQMHGGRTGSNPSQGATGASILGRLAPLLPLSRAGSVRNHTATDTCYSTGPFCEFQQESISSKSVGEVPRSHAGLTVNESRSIRTTSGQYTTPPSTVSEAGQTSIQVLPQARRYVGSSSGSHTIGPPVITSLSNMDEQSSLEPQLAQEQVDQGDTAMPSGPEVLEEQTVSDQGGCSGHDSLSEGDSPDRCVPYWLGGSVATQTSHRTVGSSGKRREYKYPGTSGSSAGSEAQGSPGAPQAAASGAKLAGETVVSSVIQTPRRESLDPSQEKRSPPAVGGSYLAPEPRPPEALCVASEGPEPLFGACDQGVQNTILNSRAPSTRSAYAYRWKLFSEWCSEQAVVPEHCPVPLVLRFLQSLLENNRAAATLRVYVAAISAHHVRIDGQQLGSHALVTQFLRGAQRLRPPQSVRVSLWDLGLVLKSLTLPPFEPLEHSDLKWISLKAAFLLAIASSKRVSELHALSVSASCMRWNADGSVVTLWPNPAFLPKRLSALFRNQAIELAVFNPPMSSALEGDGSTLLCPVRALRGYLKATEVVRKSDQLFLCYGGPKRGQPLSKQRLSHWVVEVITHAYTSNKCPVPLGVRCHSTRGISTSWAALKGVLLSDICAAATWSSTNTFARYYRVNVAASGNIGTAVLSGPSTSS